MKAIFIDNRQKHGDTGLQTLSQPEVDVKFNRTQHDSDWFYYGKSTAENL